MNIIHNTVEVKTQEAAVGSLWTDENGNTFMLAMVARPKEAYYYVAIALSDGTPYMDARDTKAEAVHGLTFVSNNATITIS